MLNSRLLFSLNHRFLLLSALPRQLLWSPPRYICGPISLFHGWLLCQNDILEWDVILLTLINDGAVSQYRTCVCLRACVCVCVCICVCDRWMYSVGQIMLIPKQKKTFLLLSPHTTVYYKSTKQLSLNAFNADKTGTCWVVGTTIFW